MEHKEHPIIFSAESVRAILDGRKTQTRRIVKFSKLLIIINRYGRVGDKLWVRENFHHYGNCYEAGNEFALVKYIADGTSRDIPMKSPPKRDDWSKIQSSLFMPRWASRINLEITDIRVERLQEITEEDAFAEGVYGGDWLGDPIGEFIKNWDSYNGHRIGCTWSSNPCIFVISFKRINDAS